jgi:hypothetical protein
MITSEADGSFTVQPMADGQPQGDPIPSKSIDDAVQSAADALGTTLSAEGSPSEESGESPAEEGAEGPAGEAAEGEAGQPESGPGEVAPNPDEEKAQYAQKSGTRPKKKPGWGDYMSMKNPMAK